MKGLWERFKAWWNVSDPFVDHCNRLVELHEQNKAREKEWLEACRRQEREELRDRFAGRALTGLLAESDHRPKPIYAADWAYEYADAMLKARGDE